MYLLLTKMYNIHLPTIFYDMKWIKTFKNLIPNIILLIIKYTVYNYTQNHKVLSVEIFYFLVFILFLVLYWKQ